MRSPLLILSLSFFAGVAVATGFASPGVEVGAALAATVVATIAALRSGRGGAAPTTDHGRRGRWRRSPGAR